MWHLIDVTHERKTEEAHTIHVWTHELAEDFRPVVAKADGSVVD